MEINKLAALLILFLFSSLAHANGWSFMSQHEQMKGFVIVDVGEVEKLRPPFNTTWDVDLYRLNGACFSIDGYHGLWGIGKKAAFLLVNERKQIKIGLLEASIGSLKAGNYSITVYGCP